MSRETSLAVSVSNLGKQFQVHRPTIREWIEGVVHGVKRESFWSLKNISFDVYHGETVGVIGRNGAGKSTLLRILARVFQPTTGSVDIYGELGSLLEIGTGIHPDLTGSENIYLNGAIIGMNRAQVRDRFREIVEFAEIAKFLDSPIKYYSTGMYMRLAFSVAVHFRADILLLDEVLAVGDQAFQKKCINKIRDIQSEGRTLFFVSHDMTQVRDLCQRAILLEKGEILADDDVEVAINRYVDLLSAGNGS